MSENMKKVEQEEVIVASEHKTTTSNTTRLIEYAIIGAIVVFGLIGCYFSVRTNEWKADGSNKQHGVYPAEKILYDGVPYVPSQE